MSDTAIRVENLGKLYHIGAAQQRHDTLRDALVARFRRNGRPTEDETLWALKDVSFEVKRGEVVGVIGRNGAGKSTLLKILSRITEPSTGHVELHGRVGSLLEVGTGFHPELTGRENIYLNGAILGMKRTEIDRKFDEIVAFSEVEKFLDTPVKRYSSGMYVRLAFAVAAHLEPEILLVDEVLSVGDLAFQRKCLGKMSKVAGEGRTVLFVSHNLATVGTLCQRTVLLVDGSVQLLAPSHEVIEKYIMADYTVPHNCRIEDDDRQGFFLVGEARIHSLCGKQLSLEFVVETPEEIRNATAGLVVYDLFDCPIFGVSSKVQGIHGADHSRRWRVVCKLGRIPLNAGTYSISLWFGNEHRDYAKFTKSISLQVAASDPYGWGNSIPSSWGYFHWIAKWEITPQS